LLTGAVVEHFLIEVAIYYILTWSIYLNYRQGHLYVGAFFTMGLAAYLTTFAIRDWGWPFELAVLTSVALGAGIAILLALRLGKASSFANMLGSLAPLLVFQVVVRNLEFLGGAMGLFAIPKVGYLLPFTLGAAALIGLAVYRWDHSHLGRAQDVLSDAPEVAATQGTTAYKFAVALETVAGAMGGLVGAIYAPFVGSISPHGFNFGLIINSATFLFVGGHTTMWGLVVFTPILWGLRIFLPSQAASWTLIIYGTLLAAVILLRPEGVITRQVLRSIRVNSQALVERLRTVRANRA
jgi:branched-chain amino acid transport system permease protein